jgi:hypothetical protein
MRFADENTSGETLESRLAYFQSFTVAHPHLVAAKDALIAGISLRTVCLRIRRSSRRGTVVAELALGSNRGLTPLTGWQKTPGGGS